MTPYPHPLPPPPKPAAVIAALLALGLACAPLPAPEPPPPPPAPVAPGDCQAAEKRLRELNCRQPNGAPWWQTSGDPVAGIEPTGYAEACEYAAADGRHWRPECVAIIRDCSEVAAAHEGRVCR